MKINLSAILGICLLTSVPFAFAGSSDASSCKVDSTTMVEAREYMKSQGLIAEGEEFELKKLDMASKWTLVRTIERDSNCLHVMELCVGSIKGPLECEHSASGSYEVLVSKNGTWMRFEKAFKVPASLVAAVGHLPGGNDPRDDFYYADFKDTSAVDAQKAIYAGIPVCGFSGEILRGKKASFDPTPNRKWSVQPVSFNLRRGVSAEAYDIRASFLDIDLDAYYKGCNGKVLPWSACYLRKVQAVDLSWTDVEYQLF